MVGFASGDRRDRGQRDHYQRDRDQRDHYQHDREPTRICRVAAVPRRVCVAIAYFVLHPGANDSGVRH